MDLKLKDKIVLVTGSTRGIGKAIAQAFAKEGAKVIITGTIKDRAVKVAEELKNTYGVETLGLEMNIADSESVKKAFSEIEKKFKGVDILDNTPIIDIKPYIENFDKIDGITKSGWMRSSNEDVSNKRSDDRFIK